VIGVTYQQQCGGVACHHRELEGYFLPVSGVGAPVVPSDLRGPFHRGEACTWREPTPDGLATLRSIVEKVAMLENGEQAKPLVLDESRVREVLESWVPVLTPLGPGVLTWPNCD
jgi:Family of unknown function (DUF6210)